MNRTQLFRSIGLCILVVAVLSGCGRARQAAQIARSAMELAESSDGESSSVDWENYDLTEADVRRFYEGVRDLNDAHPDIDFEVAMTATMEAMGAGINLENLVERETDMSFEEYGGLSTALLVVQTEAAGVAMTREMVSAMEANLAEFDEIDESELSDEQKAALEEQRQALTEAKAELDSPEFKERADKIEMVNRIREEMGF